MNSGKRPTGRIEIGKAEGDPRTLGRPLMSDHNLSARVWATAALLAVPLAPAIGLGWWLPMHLALLGAATQAIAGGQLMFSVTLGLSRGPRRSEVLYQLGLLNLGALLVVAGRWANEATVLASGATIVVAAAVWVGWRVHRISRDSPNRRFSITGTFYRLAAVSIVTGASIGGALGAGVFDDASSYLEHRSLHMTLNVFGWAGLTIVGTAITLLPTILHVRAPSLRGLRATPWLMFGGLAVLSTGASLDTGWLAGAGMTAYVLGLGTFGMYARQILVTQRRRKVPTAALHLMAALVWAAVTTLALIVTSSSSDHAAGRDLVVVGGGVGFVFQALLGAWSFILPSTRPPVPEQRRRELVAMELGGRVQVIAYNLGAGIALIGLRTDMDVEMIGISLTWTAAAWALTKSWSFPLLARLPVVQRWSERWWAAPLL